MAFGNRRAASGTGTSVENWTVEGLWFVSSSSFVFPAKRMIIARELDKIARKYWERR